MNKEELMIIGFTTNDDIETINMIEHILKKEGIPFSYSSVPERKY